MIKFDQDHRIVWIASYPRSGNTWVRAFFYALSSVARDPSCAAIDFAKMSRFISSDNSMPLFRKYLRGPLELTSRKTIAELRPKVVEDLLRTSKGAVLVKTNNTRTDDITPFIDERVTAGAIYLVRNPLDVAVSFAAFRGVPVDQAIQEMALKDFGQMTNRHSVYMRCGSWTGNVRSWLDRNDPSTLTVRYEDLLATPETAFASIAAHVMMRPSEAHLARAIALCAFDRLKESAARIGAPEEIMSADRFFRSGSVNQWRNTLTPQQVDRIVGAHGKVMERFGYLP
jgi:hypothetical protein